MSYNVANIIAEKTGVNANSLATTVLNYVNGNNGTSVPVWVEIKLNTGVFGLCQIIMRKNGNIFIPQVALGVISATKNFITSVMAGLIDNTGNISVEVAVVNGSASTFDIIVYGF